MLQRKKVLIVEDDQDSRQGLGMRLKANSYDTVAACDGGSALDVARQEQPDVILLDLGLPQGDGFSVMRELHEDPELAEIPVVVLTAWDEECLAWRVLDAGAIAFLQKPVRNQTLLDTLAGALSDSGSPSAGVPLV